MSVLPYDLSLPVEERVERMRRDLAEKKKPASLHDDHQNPDHDIEGYVVFFKAGLQETGWNQYVTIEFLRLRDLGLSDEQSDQEIWRRVQNDRLLFITNNRNREDETSLQATIEKESGADSFPVPTISSVEKLVQADYRQQVIHKLAEVILYLEHYFGVSRIYLP